MSDAILQVEHLMMHFGGIKALNDVNLEVERGIDYRPDWPERRGEDHGVQLPDRVLPRQRGRHSA